MNYLFLKIFIISLCTLSCSANFSSINDDKLVLSPVELIDLVLKERLKNNKGQDARRRATVGLAHGKIMDNVAPVVELNDDENTLKRRKVWSRWGKWGECSVTCGNGVVTRERVCTEGRCARGEREQQRRPCLRSPCDTQASLEPRDAE